MNNSNAPFVPSRAGVMELSVSLLEASPHRYYEILQVLSAREDPSLRQALKDKLNETPYETWHSNHVLSLSRLVGRLNSEAIDEYGVGAAFYGSNNVEGIPKDLAINLLKLMVNCGGDISNKDYYGKNITDILKAGEEESRFYRTGAEEYLRTVEIIQSGSTEISEGVPP
tara:strand:- start:101 stop:610 length:510 start_codon:yes stop_codon:yes gene_type:complete